MTTASPPAWAIMRAEGAASLSPCSQSKRGVVLYRHPPGEAAELYGTGYNGPPAGFTCPGRERCGDSCGKRCVHAEMRAIRGIEQPGLDLVHVKLGPDGHVTPGGPPSCWQCSREIFDVGFVAGVWLYEAMPEEWCPHIDELRVDCTYCQGKACHECDVATACANPRPRCDHDVLDRHHGLPLVDARWRYYSAADFHRATLRNAGIES
jgi:deoxycytidylate deaminase